MLISWGLMCNKVDRVRVCVMDRAVEYHETAILCLQIAESCAEPEQKARWLRIRDHWTTLAIEAENDAAGFAAFTDTDVDTPIINIDTSTIIRLLNEMRLLCRNKAVSW